MQETMICDAGGFIVRHLVCKLKEGVNKNSVLAQFMKSREIYGRISVYLATCSNRIKNVLCKSYQYKGTNF